MRSKYTTQLPLFYYKKKLKIESTLCCILRYLGKINLVGSLGVCVCAQLWFFASQHPYRSLSHYQIFLDFVLLNLVFQIKENEQLFFGVSSFRIDNVWVYALQSWFFASQHLKGRVISILAIFSVLSLKGRKQSLFSFILFYRLISEK